MLSRGSATPDAIEVTCPAQQEGRQSVDDGKYGAEERDSVVGIDDVVHETTRFGDAR